MEVLENIKQKVAELSELSNDTAVYKLEIVSLSQTLSALHTCALNDEHLLDTNLNRLHTNLLVNLDKLISDLIDLYTSYQLYQYSHEVKWENYFNNSKIFDEIKLSLAAVNSSLSLNISQPKIRDLWQDSLNKIFDWVECIVNFETSSDENEVKIVNTLLSMQPLLPQFRYFPKEDIILYNEMTRSDLQEDDTDSDVLNATVPIVRHNKVYFSTFKHIPVLVKSYHCKAFIHGRSDLYVLAQYTQDAIFKNSQYLVTALGCYDGVVTDLHSNDKEDSEHTANEKDYKHDIIQCRNNLNSGSLFTTLNIVFELAPYGTLEQFLANPPKTLSIVESQWGRSAYEPTPNDNEVKYGTVQKCIPPEVTTSIVYDVICGLEYLHYNCGVIHGHLHHNNILIYDNYRAKICDYGHVFDRNTERRNDPRWYSPEYIANNFKSSTKSNVNIGKSASSNTSYTFAVS